MALKQPVHIAFFILLALAITSCGEEPNSRKKVNEEFTLSPKDKAPFGGFVLRNFSEKIFSQQKIRVNKRVFQRWQNTLINNADTISDNHVYIIASPQVFAYEAEAEAMHDFVRRGNTLVVITDNINDIFSEKFAIRIINDERRLPFQLDLKMQDTWVQMTDTAVFTSKRYQYYYFPFLRKLSASAQYSTVNVLGTNQASLPDFLRIRMGSGQLFVITNARAFSNYFLLSSNNYQYLLSTFAYLPAYPASITWDEFYVSRVGRQPEGHSIFSALLSIPALRWSFWILAGLALLWLLSNLRRKQKMIPVIQPNTNTTVSFIQTIAQLYYSKKDHANIGRKMAAYFIEHLRSRYYMPAMPLSDNWAAMLSHKTGLSVSEAYNMTALMKKAQAGDNFTEADLLELHFAIKRIEEKK